MTTLTMAHGGTAGLVLELAFVAVPILVFVVMAVVASRRAKAAEARKEADR